MTDMTETNELAPLTAEERRLWGYASSHGGQDDNVFTRSAMLRVLADLDRKDAEIAELRETLVIIEQEVGEVYMTLTDGKFSKPNTRAVHILDAVEDAKRLNDG